MDLTERKNAIERTINSFTTKVVSITTSIFGKKKSRNHRYSSKEAKAAMKKINEVRKVIKGRNLLFLFPPGENLNRVQRKWLKWSISNLVPLFPNEPSRDELRNWTEECRKISGNLKKRTLDQ
jgi:Rad3-related DNA helicase